jgi:hypothetical protein
MLRCGTTSLFLVLAVLTLPLACRAADVTLDGAVVPKATTSMSIPVDVTEFREGGSACPILLPGCPEPKVCVTTPAPIAPLDAQLAGAPSARFTVGVEDGRSFGRCVMLSLDTTGAGGKRRYVYCLRCEGVTAP